MAQQPLKRCPVGIQTFSDIREGEYIYIDKTEYVYRMAHSDAKYCFLSRPRRFGKSLLASTLHCYFEGRKDLFKGLAIERLEKDWTVYPVLHFDMSRAKHVDKATLEKMLNVQLCRYEKEYGISERAMTLNDRMITLIQNAYKKTGKRLVVLEKYDGYHFTRPSPDIYNPFSLMNAFAYQELNDYWFGSGTPTYLIEMLRKFQVPPTDIGNMQAMAPEFDAPTETLESIIPLLYQSGYITIKDYDPITELYTLGMPNREIRIGMMQSLLPNYFRANAMRGKTTVALMYGAIVKGDMDGALRLLQTFLSTIPYCDNTDYEGHYQQMFYVIFSLFGMYVDVEVRTPRGRVDIVMRTAKVLYVIELKLDRDAESAMRQIDLKNYSERFALCGLPVIKVGINYDSEKRTITDWKIEKE